MPDVPTAGSLLMVLIGALLYEISVTALGILIATFTTSMAQFGLLCIPIVVILQLLSGSSTLMQIASTTHFVSFCQAVLYRGAGLEIVWPDALASSAACALLSEEILQVGMKPEHRPAA